MRMSNFFVVTSLLITLGCTAFEKSREPASEGKSFLPIRYSNQNLEIVADKIQKGSNGSITFQNIIIKYENRPYRLGYYTVNEKSTAYELCGLFQLKYAFPYLEGTSLWMNRNSILLTENRIGFSKLDTTGSFISHLRCSNDREDRIGDNQ